MKKKHIITAAAVLFGSSVVWAGSVGILNTFIAGTPALSSQVNANFTAIKTAVDDNNNRLNDNTASISTNSTNITNIQNSGALVRTIIVKPVIAGGVVDPIASGTALINAVNTIVSASPVTNPYLVKLEAGTYDLGVASLSLPSGVSLEGAGRSATEIKSSVAQNMVQPLAATIILLGNSVISNVTISNSNTTTTGFNQTRPSAVTLNGAASSNHFYNVNMFAENPLIIDRGSFAWVSGSKLVASTNAVAIWKTGPSSKVDVVNSELAVAGNMAGALTNPGGARCVNSHRNFTALSTACM